MGNGNKDMRKGILIGLIFLFLACNQKKDVVAESQQDPEVEKKEINNPIITDVFTADPAAIVHKDTVYLYAGHDEAPNDFHFYKMNEWLVFRNFVLKTRNKDIYD